jgi:hypothetical protein
MRPPFYSSRSSSNGFLQLLDTVLFAVCTKMCKLCIFQANVQCLFQQPTSVSAATCGMFPLTRSQQHFWYETPCYFQTPPTNKHRSTSGLVKSPTSRPSVSSRFPSYSSTCKSFPRSASAASSGVSSPSAWPRHSPSPLPPSSSARPSASHGNSGTASTRASASTTIR